PYRLDLSGGFPGEWALLHESGRFSGAVLPLGGDGPSGPGPDTLLAGTAGTTERSTDGGLTWEDVYHEKANALYAVPEGYPHAGRLLVGDLQDIAYSDDRGASFTPSVVPGHGTSTP